MWMFCNNFINSLLVYEHKYYFQVWLENCTYKILDKQVIDHDDVNLSESDENVSDFLLLINEPCYTTIELI